MAIPSSRLTVESHEIMGLERAVCEDSRNADAHHLLASSTPNSLGGLAVSNNLKQQQRGVDISNQAHDVVPLRLILIGSGAAVPEHRITNLAQRGLRF